MIIYPVEVTRGRTETDSLTTAINTNPLPYHDIIITHSGRNEQEYSARLEKLLAKLFYCPDCGSITHFNQWKTRSAWSNEADNGEIRQLQVLCTNPECKKTHVIIPDFLNPHKRYVGAEIEAAIESEFTGSSPSETQAEDSTKRRWIKQFAERLPEILNALMRLLMIEYQNMMSLLKCCVDLRRLRELLMLFPEREQATTLGRANLELFWGSMPLYF
jgi:hypothetical protein